MVSLEDRYEIRIKWSDEDKCFVASIPSIPYTGAHGDTHEEALAQAKNAIASYLRTTDKLGKPVPPTRSVTRRKKEETE